MGGQRSFLILTVFVFACLNRSRKLLLCFTSETKKTKCQDPKGQVEGWPLGLGFCFLGTVTSLPISSVTMSCPTLRSHGLWHARLARIPQESVWTGGA